MMTILVESLRKIIRDAHPLKGTTPSNVEGSQGSRLVVLTVNRYRYNKSPLAAK